MMDDIFFNTSLKALNRVRRYLGSRWLTPGEFDMRVPDEKMNLMMKELTGEIEASLSMPFGMKLRRRWLKSGTGEPVAAATESALASEFISFYDSGIENDLTALFFENQLDEGAIPDLIRPLRTTGYCAGPYLFNAIWRLAMLGKLRDSDTLFDCMNKFADWQTIHRKSVEGMYVHTSAAEFSGDPATLELRRSHPGLSGVKDSVRSVAFNSLNTCRMQIMSKLAYKFGHNNAAEKFMESSRALGELIHESMWDEDSGFYYDLVGETVVRDMAMSGFLPMAAEIPTKEQAERMMQWLPAVSDRITLLRSEPSVAPLFRLVADGLRKYGYYEEGAGYALSAALYTAGLEKTTKFMIARIVAALMLIEQVAGFLKFRDRYVLHPCLPQEWTGKPVRIYDGEWDYKISLTLGDDGNVECRIKDNSTLLYSKSIQNYTLINLKLPVKPQQLQG